MQMVLSQPFTVRLAVRVSLRLEPYRTPLLELPCIQHHNGHEREGRTGQHRDPHLPVETAREV